MPMTAEELKQITDAANAAAAAAVKPVAEALAAMAGSVKAIGEQQTAAAAAIDEIRKAKPGEPKPEPKKDDADPVLAKFTAAVEAATKPLMEKVTKIEEREAKSQARTNAEALVRKTLAEKKLGGFLKPEFARTLERIVSALPADEAAVMAQVESVRGELIAAGVKPEAFAADPAAEGAGRDSGGGGGSGGGGDAKEAERLKLEEIQAGKTAGY
ncbi:MAG: hypothetical protein IBJ10_01295 [Phycisphaerales bacterium]|nr:hypothetical protein [Phycisphaerales bacterium]